MQLVSFTEEKRLAELEKVVTKGKKAFVEVGLALMEIRDSRLYRQDFETFAEYCESKWGWTRQRAHQLIDGAQAVQSVPPEMSTLVDTETQARALATVPEPDRPAVLQAAQAAAEQEGKPMAARHITEAAKPKPAPEPEPEAPDLDIPEPPEDPVEQPAAPVESPEIPDWRGWVTEIKSHIEESEMLPMEARAELRQWVDRWSKTLC